MVGCGQGGPCKPGSTHLRRVQVPSDRAYCGLGEMRKSLGRACIGDDVALGIPNGSLVPPKVASLDEVNVDVKPLVNALSLATAPVPVVLVVSKAPAFRSRALPSADSGSTRASVLPLASCMYCMQPHDT